ncbi:hypothetical protein CEXT_29091 [Caerostris extrusa]|uniref:Uncharacterized protein n=1 Tax=Caerostris extrusa TaxID=172846 RepID=A0AAV4VM42_CAEEX|nr:hypothetical protein CEXT_29091 [Caerostris extrusa]
MGLKILHKWIVNQELFFSVSFHKSGDYNDRGKEEIFDKTAFLLLKLRPISKATGDIDYKILETENTFQTLQYFPKNNIFVTLNRLKKSNIKRVKKRSMFALRQETKMETLFGRVIFSLGRFNTETTATAVMPWTSSGTEGGGGMNFRPLAELRDPSRPHEVRFIDSLTM